MAVMKPRTRLVNFRVSEDEFQSLKVASETGGARSISDFARTAVLGGNGHQTHTEDLLRLRLALIEEKVSEVGAKLVLIARMLRDPELMSDTPAAAAAHAS